MEIIESNVDLRMVRLWKLSKIRSFAALRKHCKLGKYFIESYADIVYNVIYNITRSKDAERVG